MEEVELVSYAGIASKGKILVDYGRERDAYREAVSSALTNLPQHVSQISMGHGRLFVLFLVATDGIVFFCMGYEPLCKEQARGLLGRVRTAFLYAARKCDLHSGAPLPDATRDTIRKSFASAFRSHRGKVEEGSLPPLVIYHDAPFAYRTKSEDSFPAGESESESESEEEEGEGEGDRGGLGWGDGYGGGYNGGDADGRGGGGGDRAELRTAHSGADGPPDECDFRQGSANGGGGGGGEKPTFATRTLERSSNDCGSRSFGDGDGGDDVDDAGWVDGTPLVTGQGLKNATWQRLPASDPGIGRGRGRRKGGGGGRKRGGGNGGKGGQQSMTPSSAHQGLTPRQRLLQEVGDVLLDVGAVEVAGTAGPAGAAAAAAGAGAGAGAGAVDLCFDLGQPVRPLDFGCDLDLGEPVRPAGRNARVSKPAAADCRGGEKQQGQEAHPRFPDLEGAPEGMAATATGRAGAAAAGAAVAGAAEGAAAGFQGPGKLFPAGDGAPAGGWNTSVTLPPQALAQLNAAMQAQERAEQAGQAGEGAGLGAGEATRGAGGGERMGGAEGGEADGDWNGDGAGSGRRSAAAAVMAAQSGQRAMTHSRSWNPPRPTNTSGKERDGGRHGAGGETGQGAGLGGGQGRRLRSSQGRAGDVPPGLSPAPRPSRLSPSASLPDFKVLQKLPAAASSPAFPDIATSSAFSPSAFSPSSEVSQKPLAAFPDMGGPSFLPSSFSPSKPNLLAQELELLERESGGGAVQYIPVISSSSPGRASFPEIGSVHQGASSSSSPSRLSVGGGGDIDKGQSSSFQLSAGGGGDIDKGGRSSPQVTAFASSPGWKAVHGSDRGSHAGSSGYHVTGSFGMDPGMVFEPSPSRRSPGGAAAGPLRRTCTDFARHAATAAGGGEGGASVSVAVADGAADVAGAGGFTDVFGAAAAAAAESAPASSPANSYASSMDTRSEVLLLSPHHSTAPKPANRPAFPDYYGASSPGRVASAASYPPAASPLSSQSQGLPPSTSKARRTSKAFARAFGPKSPLSTVKSGSFWPVQTGWGGDESPASSTASGVSAAPAAGRAAAAAAAGAAAAASPAKTIARASTSAGATTSAVGTPVATGAGSSISGSSSSSSGQKTGERSIKKVWMKLFGKGWNKGGEGGRVEGESEGSEGGEEEGVGRRRRLSLYASRSEASGAGEDERGNNLRGRFRRKSLSARPEKAGFRASSATGSNPWDTEVGGGGGARGGTGGEAGGETGAGADERAYQIGKGGRQDERRGTVGSDEDDDREGAWEGKLTVGGGAKSKGRASCSV